MTDFQHGIKAELEFTNPAFVVTGMIEDASMDLTRELAEIRVWGAESVERVAGLYSINFSINGAWDPTLDGNLFSAFLSADPLALSFKPDGVVEYTLDVWISSLSQSHSSTDKSTYSLTLQSTGDLQRAP
jgi:hypothetical protein